MNRFKYPRTYHLPFSGTVFSDDKLFKDLSFFEGKIIQASLKMDGENTTLYSDNYSHARSIDSKSNYTRDIVKSIHSKINHLIPKGYRLCCENLYAKHSIYYPDGYLEGYLYLLSVWNEKNQMLSLEDTKRISKQLNLPMPKEIYLGKFDLNILTKLAKSLNTEIEEGFVIRLIDPIDYENFSCSVAKYVRKNHVQNKEHWLKNTIPNGKPNKF